MKYIVCECLMFELQQRIRLVDEEKDSITDIAISTIENLSQSLADACMKEQVYNIHLFGNEDYIRHKVVDPLLKFSREEYCTPQYNIEVN